MDDNQNETEPGPRQPVFNVPAVILCLIAVFCIVHAYRVMAISREADFELVFGFSFIPARYTDAGLAEAWPMAGYWSPLTYSLLHADWVHVMMNSFWLLAFGAVVARRIGATAFLILAVMGSLAGAFVHYMAHAGEILPMIGASAVVSACMGAAVRFAFPRNGRFSTNASHLPIQSLRQALQNSQALIFTGVWFAVNILFGAGIVDITNEGQTIAWEAHIGGFLAGLLLIGWIDNQKVAETE